MNLFETKLDMALKEAKDISLIYDDNYLIRFPMDQLIEWIEQGIIDPDELKTTCGKPFDQGETGPDGFLRDTDTWSGEEDPEAGVQTTPEIAGEMYKRITFRDFKRYLLYETDKVVEHETDDYKWDQGPGDRQINHELLKRKGILDKWQDVL